ncbi:unnamed protein product [Lymnaea stagnalis]|uniref:G-protein coupled receptors family 1 profile domain-containing protein n=1 Tax=Lymnaea stagnalis TaxID=6523 RepID=A0AAV2I2T8_LYMST
MTTTKSNLFWFLPLSKNSSEIYQRMSFHGGGAFDDLFESYTSAPNALEELIEANRLWTIVLDISVVYFWVIFAIGLPANVLALITILKMQVITPATILIAVLASLDGLALIGKFVATVVVQHDLYLGTTGCRFQFLIIYVSTMANWALAYICAERFVSMWYPLLRDKYLSKKSLCLALVATGLSFFIVFATISIVMRGADNTGHRCGTRAEHVWFHKNIWYWINASLFLFVPCLCIVPLTLITIVKLFWSRKPKHSETDRYDFENEAGNANTERKNQRTVTIMMTLAAVTFILLSLPSCIYYLAYKSSNDIVVEARWAVFEQVQFVFIDSSHAVNFFIYFLSSKLFRDRLYELVLPKSVSARCTRRASDSTALETKTEKTKQDF